MKRADALTLLRHQRDRGPLPLETEGLSTFIAGLHATMPLVDCPISEEAVLPLRALGIAVTARDDRFFARFPADGDALDQVLALIGAPAIPGGGASKLFAALEQGEAEQNPPPISLPLRMRPAKASSLGWSPELFSLTVLISNATMRKRDGAILAAGSGPVVAVCAEYERALTSLDPPFVAGYPFDRAREQGMPTLRLPSGWLTGPLRLEATHRGSRAPSGRPAAMARATKFLAELDHAWKRNSGQALEVAWPVYRPERRGPLLDAVMGRPLPEIELT